MGKTTHRSHVHVIALATASVLLLSACNAFNVTVPRYNTVLGEKRIPHMNPGATGDLPTMEKRSLSPEQLASAQGAVQQAPQVQPMQQPMIAQPQPQAMMAPAPLVAAPQFAAAPVGYADVPPPPPLAPVIQAPVIAAPQPMPEPIMPEPMPQPAHYQQQPIASADAFPVLPSTMQEQWQATPQDVNSLQQEIAALEAELSGNAVPPAPMPVVEPVAVEPVMAPMPVMEYAAPQPVPAPPAPAPAPVVMAPEPAPVMQPQPIEQAMVDTAMAEPLPPFRLPPPPALDGIMVPTEMPVAVEAPVATRRAPSQQPVMQAEPMIAEIPVIDDSVVMQHANDWVAAEPVAPAPVNVPLMPEVQTAMPVVPTTLIPPDVTASGRYLPSSRYAGRR